MSYREIAYAVMLLTPATALTGVIITIARRKHLTGLYKLLSLYLLLALLTDLLSRFIGTVYGNNLILVPLFGLAELALFTFLFHRYLLPRKYPFIIGMIIACALLIGLDLFGADWGQPTHFHAYGRVLSGLLIATLSLISLGHILRNPQRQTLPNLALCAGILIYYAIDSLWFISVNFMVNQEVSTVFGLWMVHALVTPLFYIFLTHHIWRTGRILKP
ncbi:MAG TPA: hypothetical protein DCG19_07670 [Cryomorphaceae bacterium]|nr:hypothetical protein [Owenweeksia sp.]HAD97269.1 hypothetical protein [Cryomorphaceae bacterium]MBF98556.1 hypothetical protein [Owenweeksia sp.]MBF99791.1 hypothetical protein [Owenweeksia sp.]HBF20682.1 hypothetical protein [Cryomorphaceae bacterium]|tara:strand:- start:2300 stop:2953 length:654 start_codon:yes stop_codon:yes gene_type:complete